MQSLHFERETLAPVLSVAVGGVRYSSFDSSGEHVMCVMENHSLGGCGMLYFYSPRDDDDGDDCDVEPATKKARAHAHAHAGGRGFLHTSTLRVGERVYDGAWCGGAGCAGTLGRVVVATKDHPINLFDVSPPRASSSGSGSGSSVSHPPHHSLWTSRMHGEQGGPAPGMPAPPVSTVATAVASYVAISPASAEFDRHVVSTAVSTSTSTGASTGTLYGGGKRALYVWDLARPGVAVACIDTAKGSTKRHMDEGAPGQRGLLSTLGLQPCGGRIIAGGSSSADSIGLYDVGCGGGGASVMQLPKVL